MRKSERAERLNGVEGAVGAPRLWRALVRLEAPRGDGRQFVEPGDLVKLDAATAEVLEGLGLIEPFPDEGPKAGDTGPFGAAEG